MACCNASASLSVSNWGMSTSSNTASTCAPYRHCAVMATDIKQGGFTCNLRRDAFATILATLSCTSASTRSMEGFHTGFTSSSFFSFHLFCFSFTLSALNGFVSMAFSRALIWRIVDIALRKRREEFGCWSENACDLRLGALNTDSMTVVVKFLDQIGVRYFLCIIWCTQVIS